MLSEDQKNRMTAEELLIAEKWDLEQDMRDAIFAQMQIALAANNNTKLIELGEKLGAITPSHCEHDIFIYNDCSACSVIEKKLRNELSS